MIQRFKPGYKKCKGCGKDFEKDIRKPFALTCSIACALEWNKKQNEKKEAKAWNAQKKDIKDALTTYSEWLKRLELEVNPIARIIDHDIPCISCEKTTGKPQAGHYHTVQSDGTLRYNLHNIHLQDYYCNVPKSGNMPGYDKGLIANYGNHYWEYVKFDLKRIYATPLKLSIPEIKTLITRARHLRKEIQLEKRTPEQRIRLRDEINTKLGIYKIEYL